VMLRGPDRREIFEGDDTGLAAVAAVCARDGDRANALANALGSRRIIYQMAVDGAQQSCDYVAWHDRYASTSQEAGIT